MTTAISPSATPAASRNALSTNDDKSSSCCTKVCSVYNTVTTKLSSIGRSIENWTYKRLPPTVAKCAMIIAKYLPLAVILFFLPTTIVLGAFALVVVLRLVFPHVITNNPKLNGVLATASRVMGVYSAIMAVYNGLSMSFAASPYLTLVAMAVHLIITGICFYMAHQWSPESEGPSKTAEPAAPPAPPQAPAQAASQPSTPRAPSPPPAPSSPEPLQAVPLLVQTVRGTRPPTRSSTPRTASPMPTLTVPQSPLPTISSKPATPRLAPISAVQLHPNPPTQPSTPRSKSPLPPLPPIPPIPQLPPTHPLATISLATGTKPVIKGGSMHLPLSRNTRSSSVSQPPQKSGTLGLPINASQADTGDLFSQIRSFSQNRASTRPSSPQPSPILTSRPLPVAHSSGRASPLTLGLPAATFQITAPKASPSPRTTSAPTHNLNGNESDTEE